MLEVYPPYMADDQSTDLDEFETGLLTWLVESDFHVEKVPNRIQIFYKNGALHIAAD